MAKGIKIQLKERAEVFGVKRKLRGNLKQKGESMKERVHAIDKHSFIVDIDEGVDSETVRKILDNYPSDHYETEDIDVEEELGRPNVSELAEEAGKKVTEEIEARHAGYEEGLLKRIETVEEENEELYGNLEEEIREKELEEQRISELEKELEEMKDRERCGAPLEGAKNLVDALREDYERLQGLRLGQISGMSQEDLQDPETISELLSVDDRDEYLEKVLREQPEYSLNELEDLPDRFEDTEEGRQYDEEEIEEARDRLDYVEEADGKVERELPKSLQEQVEKDSGLVENYDQAREEFEKKKQFKEDLEVVEGTYDTVREIQQKVEYRRKKGSNISYLITDQEEDGDLSVKIMVPLEQGEDDPISGAINTHVRKGLGVASDKLFGHTSYSDSCKIFSRRFSLGDENRYEVTGEVKQHLDDYVGECLFSALGAGVELTHRSKKTA